MKEEKDGNVDDEAFFLLANEPLVSLPLQNETSSDIEDKNVYGSDINIYILWLHAAEETQTSCL